MACRVIQDKIVKTTDYFVRRTTKVWLELVKVLVPLVILVELLEWLGLIEVLNNGIAPLMGLVGLPGEAALVWATTLVTNLYGGMIVFSNLFQDNPLSVAETTVLASMMLTAHALPIELGICRRAGAAVWYCLTLRIGGAFLYGALLWQAYRLAGTASEPALILFKPAEPNPGFAAWLFQQACQLAYIWLIILTLLLVLALLKRVRLIDVLEQMLYPVVRPLKLSREAVPILITGLTFGITFGGGLLIEAAQAHKVSKRDVYLSIGFLCLCHSLIEDTLLMVLIGGSLSGILFGHFLFAFVVIFLISLILKRKDHDELPCLVSRSGKT